MNLTGVTASGQRLATLLTRVLQKHNYFEAAPHSLDELLVAAEQAATGQEIPSRCKALRQAAQTPWNPTAFLGFSPEACKLIQRGFSHALETIAEMASQRDTEPTEKHWVLSMPVISTGHITRSTNDLLTADQLSPSVASCAGYEHGFFLSVPITTTSTKEQPIPDDLAIVWAWARVNGFQWLRLDADGDEVEGLPTHDW